MDRPTDSPIATASEVTPLLTYEETAAVLHVQVATLRKWVRQGRLPVVHLTRRTVRFRAEDVRRFIDEKVGLMERSRMNGPLGSRPIPTETDK